MINEPITHATPFPPERSAGPDNAYYLRHCVEIERGPAYTACLSRLHDLDIGVSNERTAECAKALRENRCVAAGMREQERLAGNALFYFPRGNKPFLPVQVAGDFGVLITNLTDPALIPKPVKAFGAKVVASGSTKPAHELQTPAKKLEDELQTDALAIAITNAAAAAPAPTIAEVKKMVEAIPPAELPPLPPMLPPGTGSAAPKIQPGETPLQFARRMAALRNAPKT